MASPGPEVILCDTSFLGHLERRARHPERYGGWAGAGLSRLEVAILAVTPFSLAEIHAGRLADGWGEKRMAEQDRRLAGLLLIPLDPEIVRRWAELRANGIVNGWRIGDNDLGVAATALATGVPLVSCDADHARVPGLDLILLQPPS